jgi:ABC-type Fe3+-hydroxamate transport system substrate-binding protein
MKRTLFVVLSILTMITLTACTRSAPQTQPEPATATQAPAQPTDTSIPPTAVPTDTVAPTVALPTETETAVPATEAQASTGGVSYSSDVYPILQA